MLSGTNLQSCAVLGEEVTWLEGHPWKVDFGRIRLCRVILERLPQTPQWKNLKERIDKLDSLIRARL